MIVIETFISLSAPGEGDSIYVVTEPSLGLAKLTIPAPQTV
jgi:hypothetical protein